MTPNDEAELVSRCREGDPRAWDALFELHYAATSRFLFQLSPDFSREDVEEICQDVFLSVIRNIGSFNGGSQVQTWVFRIAVNKAWDFRERQHAVKRGGGRVPVSLQAADPEQGMMIDPPTSAPGPDVQLLHAEERELIRAALDRLGGPCREIIALRYFADLSYQEIASALRLNEKTVSSRLSKCLNRLETVARPMFGQTKAKWEKTTPFSV